MWVSFSWTSRQQWETERISSMGLFYRSLFIYIGVSFHICRSFFHEHLVNSETHNRLISMALLQNRRVFFSKETCALVHNMGVLDPFYRMEGTRYFCAPHCWRDVHGSLWHIRRLFCTRGTSLLHDRRLFCKTDVSSTLQHTAAHCSTLHHTASHCTTLHHTQIVVYMSRTPTNTLKRALFPSPHRRKKPIHAQFPMWSG